MIGAALTLAASAQVTWMVKQVGADVVLSTVGSLQVGSTTNELIPYGTTNIGTGDLSNTILVAFGDRYYKKSGVGSYTPFFFANTYEDGIASGDSFGQARTALFWSVTEGSTPGTITPRATLVFPNHTISEYFGTLLDDGMRHVTFTVTETNDTIGIQLQHVPEPSSTALLGIGVLGFLIRRKR